MNDTKDGSKYRQLHIEDYLQMVSAEQKEYAEVYAHQRISENNAINTDFQTRKTPRMGLYDIHGAISESTCKLEKRRIRNRTYGAVGGRENLINFPSYPIETIKYLSV
ncbi:MAG: hypothetical protein ACOX7R_13905 [Acetivibrionales bacterium]